MVPAFPSGALNIYPVRLPDPFQNRFGSLTSVSTEEYTSQFQILCSTIPTDSPTYAQVILQYSGSAALSLVDCANTLWLGEQDRQKIQELVLSALPGPRSLAWCGCKKFLLPHLETLNLDELHMEARGTANHVLFPKSLRYLRLPGCQFESYEWLSALSNSVELTMLSFAQYKSIAVDT
ncbi:hypothetical protein BDN72DRAFT_895994 [Pluteus cervinus]|uniref:Uncharacterized protein n=1 Tax=Pluteus cervinus TaxID=181527 RepID=A0ACD3B092_9AGAR|nr:hypothetical protein BDN72DRAFT_895994 [Pluteus cervinus]